MGGSRQPYLYQPVTHAPFNPRAYTESVATPPPPRARPDGPLINFNRHPDSYDNLPYGRNLVVEEMSRGDKKRIIWTRRVQLAWRLLQLAASVILLVCVLTIRGIPDAQGWILRLPPAFDFAISTYGIWHLAHAAAGRPPASAASYHAFALLMDIGLVPFYVFIGILTKQKFDLPDDAAGRWRTLLKDQQQANTVFHMTWLTALIAAGLHAVTLVFGCYLIVKFRQIANLPPDMNPLEENTTSRAKKHKYKNSDMSALIPDEQRFSEISSRSRSRSKPAEEFDPLRASTTSEKLMGDRRASGVSFFQSRGGNLTSYSPHNPDTARQSWYTNGSSIYEEPDMYQQGDVARRSRLDVDRMKSINEYGPSRVRSPMPGRPNISKRNSANSATAMSSIPVYDDNAQSMGEGEENNWEVVPPEHVHSYDHDDFDPSHAQPAPLSIRNKSYRPLHPSEELRRSLRMNPPSPEPSPHPMIHPSNYTSQDATLTHPTDKENHPTSSDEKHASSHLHRTTTISSASSSQYSESAPAVASLPPSFQSSPAQPKPKFYTDLAAAMRGVRQPPSPSPSTAPATGTGTQRAARSEHGDLRSKGTVVRKTMRDSDEEPPARTGNPSAGGARVVSRSGADIEVLDFGMPRAEDTGDLGVQRRAREVSGKIAEEGRGTLWRRISRGV